MNSKLAPATPRDGPIAGGLDAPGDMPGGPPKIADGLPAPAPTDPDVDIIAVPWMFMPKFLARPRRWSFFSLPTILTQW